MISLKGTAPAKVNLTLHVTGKRDDGYHLLDSLVVFADIADQICVTRASDLQLSVNGPFSAGVPVDQTNLVMRAALLLQRMRNVTQGAVIELEKHLPNAAGIGGGSADAASTLNLLAELWEVAPLPASAPEIAALGADVPVCLTGPRALRMSGIGEVLSPVGNLPRCALVLVNPKVNVPTGKVFDGLTSVDNPAMAPLAKGLDFGGFTDWVNAQRNDLTTAAEAIAPEITTALKALRAHHGVAAAGMSGSGATCWALVKDMAAARHVARALQVGHMDWWVTPAQVL